MASPVETFKNSLFGQLKSYSNAVQGAFEQRIARPLLTFKRDLSRPTSENRVPTDQENASSYRTRQESTSSSSPLEINDIDTTGSFKSIFDKVKNTLSPSTKRRTSENPVIDETKNGSISSLTNKNFRKSRLTQHKSVSFAETVENDNDNDNQYSIDDRNEIIRSAQTLADHILMASIDEATGKTRSFNNNEDDFERDFHRKIKPRSISVNHSTDDLIYQDLSAEIVAYVLKHALRTLRKEQEELTISTVNNNEQDDDFIDLK